MAGVDFRRILDCAGVGFGAVRTGGFLPVEAAGGHKTVAGAYFRILWLLGVIIRKP